MKCEQPNRRSSSLNELTPYLILLGITHLGSEASKYSQETILHDMPEDPVQKSLQVQNAKIFHILKQIPRILKHPLQIYLIFNVFNYLSETKSLCVCKKSSYF